MIAIINYGLGNINAFVNIFKKASIPVTIASKEDDLTGATKIILPGVGAFDHAMEKLNESGMRERLELLVVEQEIPVLGICVGMQILAESSDEGKLNGLGWVKGKVRKFDTSNMTEKTHLPHMGWNEVKPLVKNSLFEKISKKPLFYFLHSYYFECKNEENTLAVADYVGGDFTCAVKVKNIYGVQFHPEKSHSAGVQLLTNFATLS